MSRYTWEWIKTGGVVAVSFLLAFCIDNYYILGKGVTFFVSIFSL